jgi:hypothetical protein
MIEPAMVVGAVAMARLVVDPPTPALKPSF